MEIHKLKAIIEGLLFASGDEGVTLKQLARVIGEDLSIVMQLLLELKEDFNSPERGIGIMQSHDVFYLTTKPEHSAYYKRLLETPAASRLSQAALETLAIIAYQQPITRTEIDEIRGVKSDRAVQTLVARSLVEETGRKDGVGRPVLFGTTAEFLTFFGLTSLSELPPLPEDMNQEDVEQEADLFFESFHHNH